MCSELITANLKNTRTPFASPPLIADRQIQPLMNDTTKPTRRKITADGLFFFAFIFCLGFILPIATLIGRKSLQLPIVVITVLVLIRLIVRPAVWERFKVAMRQPIAILFLIFVVLAGFYAIPSALISSEVYRITSKPALLLGIFVLLIYAFSNYMEIDRNRLSKYLMAGVLLCLILIISVSYWAKSDFVLFLDSQYGLVEARKLNRALEVASVLVFLVGAGVTRRFTSILSTILLCGTVIILSFSVVGAAFWSGVWHPAVQVTSETVQFGMPIALSVYILALLAPRLVTNIVFGSTAILLATAPWLYQLFFQQMSYWAASSANVGIQKLLIRADIWDSAARKIVESPLVGNGIDSARYTGNIIISTIYAQSQKVIHPHNMILQIWLDIGAAGILSIVGMVYFGWQYTRKLPAESQPAVIGGVSMLLLFAIVSHSFWQSWVLAVMAGFITLVAILYRPIENKTTQP